MLPNVLGIGAPKAATTWLFQCLREHPEVFMAEVKETDYFSYRFPSTPQEEYEQHFEAATDEAAVGELSTMYLADPDAPERAYSTIPESKLFVSLRNPVDQVYSFYWHRLRQNFQRGQSGRPSSFEEGLEMYPDQLLEQARYYRHLSRWLSHYDQSQLCVVLYDEISQRPDEVLRRLFEFLNVDPTFKPNSLQEKGRSVRRGSSPRGDLWENMYAYLYEKAVSNAYSPLKRLIGGHRAEKIKNALHAREVMEAIFRSKGYPKMNRDTREYLQEYFEDDIRSLGRLIGRDLGHWQ